MSKLNTDLFSTFIVIFTPSAGSLLICVPPSLCLPEIDAKVLTTFPANVFFFMAPLSFGIWTIKIQHHEYPQSFHQYSMHQFLPDAAKCCCIFVKPVVGYRATLLRYCIRDSLDGGLTS